MNKNKSGFVSNGQGEKFPYALVLVLSLLPAGLGIWFYLQMAGLM